MDWNLLLEGLATLFGLLYVLLAVYERRLAWVFGIASSGIAIYFFLNAKLYSESLLYSYYVLAGFYAWIYWGKNPASRSIERIGKKAFLKYILLGTLLTAALGFAFSKTDAAYPYFDAATSMFSFIATWLTARKILENWLFWIVIDLASAGLYALKDLYMLSALMLVYTAVAIFGYLKWKRSEFA